MLTHHLLEAFPVTIAVPVQWGELDAYGHVNNTVFFRYFESARIAYFERCGFLESYQHDQIGAILHSTSCRFRKPLFYPDTALVGARVTEVAEDRFTMAYRVVSEREGAVAAEGTGVIVAFDYRARHKAAVPAKVLSGIQATEHPPAS